MTRRNAFSELANSENSIPGNAEQTPSSFLHREPLDLIPTASLKKKRSRLWEKNHRHETVTYRGIPKSILDEVVHLSDTLLVPRDEVIRALLEFSLTRYRQGELKLIAYPKAQRMTLFPDGNTEILKYVTAKESPSRWFSKAYPPTDVYKKKNRQKKGLRDHELPAWQIRVTFRIPYLLKEEVRSVARDHSVGVGEVVWRFVMEGLQAFASGALPLRPIPKSIGKTLFQEGER